MNKHIRVIYGITGLIVVYEQTYQGDVIYHRCSYLLYMNKHIRVIFKSSLFLLAIYEQTYQNDYYAFTVFTCYI